MSACGPAVATPADGDGSTGGDPPSGGSTGPATSSVPPNPTSPTNPDPPQTSTDPYDPTTGGFGDTEGSSTNGCGFIGCHGSGGPIDDCDLFEQDCPPGEKCTPWANDGGNSWNATRCTAIVDDPDAAGEPCTVEATVTSGVDSCELGSMCWDVDDETGFGVCTPHCVGSPGAPSCEDPTRVCIMNGGGVLSLCLPTCDPLMDECGDGEGCYPFDNRFLCTVDGSGTGGGLFESCEFVNGCEPGTACVAGDLSAACDSAACCTPFCDMTAPDCPDALVCFPWYEKGTPPPGTNANVGVCADADGV
ncbi:MAG: hypothetical protein ACRBN8_16385 [Nannocystales bacterium]